MMWMTRVAAAVLLVLLVVVSVPAWRHLREQPPPPPPVVRAAFPSPSGSELGAGDDILDATISADGRRVAFVATTAGAPGLWQRSADETRANLLPGTVGASLPVWSHSGDALLFFSEASLKQLALPTGEVLTLAEAPSPAGAASMPDGSVLFSPTARGPLRRIGPDGETDATRLQPGDIAHVFPAAVGEEGDYLYVAVGENGRRVIRLSEGGQEHELGRTSGHAIVVDRVLIHVLDGTLTAQPLDPETGAPAGQSTALAFGVGVSPSGHAFFAASSRLLAWAAASPRSRILVWLDMAGHRLGTLGEPADYWQVRLGPDDRRAAMTLLEPLLRTLDVFVKTVDERSAPLRLSVQLSPDTDPVWAPDGARVLFRTSRAGRADLVTRPFAASDVEETLAAESGLDGTASDWRGRLVLVHAPGSSSGTDIWSVDVATGERQEVVHRGFNESDGRWSPDGRWIAYVSDEPGQPDIFVQRWPSGMPRVRATLAGGTRPRWARDGRTLLFVRSGRLMRTTMDTRAALPSFSDAEPVGDVAEIRDFDAAHRSDRLLAITPVERVTEAAAELIVDWRTALVPTQ